MNLQTIVMWAALGGLALALPVLAVVWCREHQVFPVRMLLMRFRALPVFVQIGLCVAVAHLVVYGSTKGSTNEPPSLLMGLVSPASES